jgi:hypothetical protein
MGDYYKLLDVQSTIRMMKSNLVEIQDIDKSKGLFDYSSIKTSGTRSKT